MRYVPAVIVLSGIVVALGVNTVVTRAQIAPTYGSVLQNYSKERIAEGVYAFIAPTSKGSFVNSNTLVVVGHDGVLVVDSGNVLSITRRIDAKVVATGDLVVAPTPYASDSFYLEWPDTMRRLMAIDAVAIMPGHGPILHDWSYPKLVTDLLESVLRQVQQAVAQKLTIEDTRKRVDVESFRSRFTNGDPFMTRMFDQLFLRPAIDRAYAEVTERAKK